MRAGASRAPARPKERARCAGEAPPAAPASGMDPPNQRPWEPPTRAQWERLCDVLCAAATAGELSAGICKALTEHVLEGVLYEVMAPAVPSCAPHLAAELGPTLLPPPLPCLVPDPPRVSPPRPSGKQGGFLRRSLAPLRRRSAAPLPRRRRVRKGPAKGSVAALLPPPRL